MKNFVLILGGEYALRERAFAGALRAFDGGKVYTIAKQRNGTTLKFFDGVIDGDVSSPESVIEALVKHKLVTGETPSAVIPMNDFVVRTGLAVAQHFQLRYQSPEAVELCRDKYAMKVRLADAGLPVARFASFSTYEELVAMSGDLTFPIVIKPREFAGSAGVIKVETVQDLKMAYDTATADVNGLLKAYHVPENAFQAEEYIPADAEVSIEVINFDDEHHVLSITDKYLGAEPYFVEVGHSSPSRFNDLAPLRQLAVDACAALGITTGMAHAEVRIMPNGEFRIIEVGARTGGDAIMDLIERVYGVNPYQLHTEAYLGKRPSVSLPLQAKGVSAVAFLKAEIGIMEKVTGMSQLPVGVVNMQVTTKPGDKSEAPLSWRAREGSVEFHWPELTPGELKGRHLELARKMSGEMFQVRA